MAIQLHAATGLSRKMLRPVTHSAKHNGMSEHPLEQWRVNQGLTQAEAAARLKISRPYFNQLVNGERFPSGRTMHTISITTGGFVNSGHFDWPAREGNGK